MLLDSHKIKSPSFKVGTKPLGFISRYAFSSLRPTLPPQSTRSKSIPSSPQHHSTFCTLEESVLPQILIMVAPDRVKNLLAFLITLDDKCIGSGQLHTPVSFCGFLIGNGGQSSAEGERR